jgi:hypothetical protein
MPYDGAWQYWQPSPSCFTNSVKIHLSGSLFGFLLIQIAHQAMMLHEAVKTVAKI